MENNNNNQITSSKSEDDLTQFFANITQNGNYGCKTFEITQFRPEKDLGNLYFKLGLGSKKTGDGVHFVSRLALGDDAWSAGYIASLLKGIQRIDFEGETFITLLGPEAYFLDINDETLKVARDIEKDDLLKQAIAIGKALGNQQPIKHFSRTQSFDNLKLSKGQLHTTIGINNLKLENLKITTEQHKVTTGIQKLGLSNLTISNYQHRVRIEIPKNIPKKPRPSWAQRNIKKSLCLVGLASWLGTLAAVKYWPVFASRAESWHSEIYLYAKVGAASLVKYATSLLRK